MGAVAVHAPVAGSYTSALDNEVYCAASGAPPVTSSLPLNSRVVVWFSRAIASEPIAVHVPAAGSYSSQVVVEPEALTWPPAASTFPLDSNVAVCVVRNVVNAPLAVQVPVAGLYSSELVRRTVPLKPPTTRTVPLGSNVAECPARAPLSAPVVVKEAALACCVTDKLSASAANASASRTTILGCVFIKFAVY